VTDWSGGARPEHVAEARAGRCAAPEGCPLNQEPRHEGVLGTGASLSPLAVARACLQAYVGKDREAIEALIAEDY
jgi:hypothetical protein